MKDYMKDYIENKYHALPLSILAFEGGCYSDLYKVENVLTDESTNIYCSSCKTCCLVFTHPKKRIFEINCIKILSPSPSLFTNPVKKGFIILCLGFLSNDCINFQEKNLNEGLKRIQEFIFSYSYSKTFLKHYYNSKNIHIIPFEFTDNNKLYTIEFDYLISVTHVLFLAQSDKNSTNVDVESIKVFGRSGVYKSVSTAFV